MLLPSYKDFGLPVKDYLHPQVTLAHCPSPVVPDRIPLRGKALHRSTVIGQHLVKFFALTIIFMALSACSRDVDPNSILLTPQEFPDRNLELGRPSDPYLATPEHSAQTVLVGDGYLIYQSIAAFEDSTRAAKVLTDLKSNLAPIGYKIAEAPVIGQDVVGIIRDRSLTQRIFVVFRAKHLLIRVTLEGDGTPDDLAVFAQAAWEKAR